MKLLWPSFLDSQPLEQLGESTERLHPQDLALLHPDKRRLVQYLRTKVK